MAVRPEINHRTVGVTPAHKEMAEGVLQFNIGQKVRFVTAEGVPGVGIVQGACKHVDDQELVTVRPFIIRARRGYVAAHSILLNTTKDTIELATVEEVKQAVGAVEKRIANVRRAATVKPVVGAIMVAAAALAGGGRRH